jgi:uncharacterized repeat protein (TIGR03803 family)
VGKFALANAVPAIALSLSRSALNVADIDRAPPLEDVRLIESKRLLHDKATSPCAHRCRAHYRGGIHRFNTIYTFPTSANGYWPRGGLAIDSAGALYGTTFYATNCTNSPNCGTIYKLAPPAAGQTAWSYQLLHMFEGDPDGIAPISPLTNYQNVMYGTASAGGDPNCGCGAIFSITTGGSYNLLHTFDPHVVPPTVASWPNGTTPIGGC